jgi:hypothetical protein
VKIICAYCGNEKDKPTGEVNRARKIGAPIYCDKVCAGLGRRKPPKTIEQKKAEKAAYDATRRSDLADRIRVEKAAAYQKYRQKPGFLERERERRKENMHRHIEYCKNPKYVEYKREYDRKYRAKEDYGELWECFILMLELRRECLKRMPDYDIRLSKGTLGKSQKRKREYERRVNCRKPEIGPLGDIKTGQRR